MPSKESRKSRPKKRPGKEHHRSRPKALLVSVLGAHVRLDLMGSQVARNKTFKDVESCVDFGIDLDSAFSHQKQRSGPFMVVERPGPKGILCEQSGVG